MARRPCPTRDRLFEVVHGLAGPRERRAAHEHAARCAACERALRELAADRVASELYREPAAAGAPRGGSTSPARRAVAAAAVAAAAIAVLAWFGLREPPASFADGTVWPPLGATNVLRSTEPEFDAAGMIAAYRAHDARRVVELSDRLEPSPATAFYVLLRASALLALERPAEALDLLDRMAFANLPQPGLRRARWLEYVAHRRLGHDARADRLLADLTAEGGSIGTWARREQARSR